MVTIVVIKKRPSGVGQEVTLRIHTPTEIGLLVQDTRHARGWSREQLAERLGATRQWVRMLESGKPRLELGLTLRALTALGIGLEVIPPADATVSSEHERVAAPDRGSKARRPRSRPRQ